MNNASIYDEYKMLGIVGALIAMLFTWTWNSIDRLEKVTWSNIERIEKNQWSEDQMKEYKQGMEKQITTLEREVMTLRLRCDSIDRIIKDDEGKTLDSAPPPKSLSII